MPESNHRKLILLSIFNGTALIGCAVFFIFIFSTNSGADTNAGTCLPVSKGGTGCETIPIAAGGTGLIDSPSLLTNLASTTAANVLQASPRPGVSGVLPIANGGTGDTAVNNTTVVGNGITFYLYRWGKVVFVRATGTPSVPLGDKSTVGTLPAGYRPVVTLAGFPIVRGQGPSCADITTAGAVLLSCSTPSSIDSIYINIAFITP